MTTTTALEQILKSGKISKAQFRKFQQIKKDYSSQTADTYTFEEKSRYAAPTVNKTHVVDDIGLAFRIINKEPTGVNRAYRVRYILDIYKTPVSQQ